MKEFEQAEYNTTVFKLRDNLIGMNAVDILDKTRIVSDVYVNALSYLMFLKRKRAGEVKARGCADGTPQQEFISKDESSSPTVSLYALFISSVMDAMDERQVVACDNTGTFLQSNLPKDNHCYLNFEGLMVNMICEIYPWYTNNVLTNKKTGKKKLYGKLTKEIYKTLLEAILFYQKLSG